MGIARLILMPAFILSLALGTVGPGAAGDELNLSLDEGVRMVLQDNLDIEIERISPQIETARIEREHGVFDMELFASFEGEKETTPLSSRSSVAAGGRTSTITRTYTFNSGVTGKAPLGTEYTLEVKDIRTTNTFNNFDPEYDSFAGLTVTQPLLKGFGTDVNRYKIHLARKSRKISHHQLKARIIEAVSEFELAYWELVLALRELRVRRESFALAEKLLDENRKRFEAEVLSRLDVTQAEAGVAARNQDVIMARKDVREKENQLKRLISKDLYALKDTAVVPTDNPVYTPAQPDLDDSLREAFASNTEYLETRLEIEKSDIEVRYAKNQIYPNVDLKASIGYNGLGGNVSDTLSDMEGGSEWSMGVVFKYPLGNRAAGSSLRIARMEARKSLLNLKRIEQDILVKIDNAIKDIGTAAERIRAAKASVRFAEQSHEAEQIRHEAGLTTTYKVLQIQEDLSKARSSEISALVDHKKALVVYMREKGTLLEQRGIAFAR